MFTWCDKGPTKFVWAWPGDLLTSRLISVMLLTIGWLALVSLRSRRRARMRLALIVTYGIGLVGAGLTNLAFSKPVQYGYVVGLGCAAVAAAFAIKRSA